MKPRTVIVALGCAVLVAFALAACGDDDDDSNATSKPAPAAPAPKGAPFVIGHICSCSGAQARLVSGYGRAAKAWASWINASGGINGRPVKLISKDDGQNPANALRFAKELVEQHKVMAIIDNSGVDQAFASYLDKAGVPVTGGTSINAPFLTSPNFFPSGTQVVAELIALVKAAKDEGKKKYGVAFCAESPICSQIVQLGQAGAKIQKMGFASIKVSATAPNYTAPCLELKNQGVDAVYVALAAETAPRFADQCAQQGYKPQYFVILSALSNKVLENPNLQGEIVNFGNANPYDESIPAVKEFRQALAKYAPAELENLAAAYIYPWSGGQLFAAAAKAGKLTPSSTPADVKKALYQLKDETLGGLAPPLNFSQGKPANIPCSFNLQISDNEFKSLDDGKPTCLSSSETAAVAAIVKAF
jgi:branched-chain amino acid transport system substrate-binding protein